MTSGSRDSYRAIPNQPRYRPEFSIEGGMGVVVKCQDSATDRFVALKTFKPSYLPHRAARERFLYEAVNWVLLSDHPNIVRALGITQVNNPPQPCIVLEWVEGRYPDADPSLATVLNQRRRRPLGFIRSLEIALGIARGMSHATNVLSGFVHNDLKPENILIDADWHPRITDLGLSHSRTSVSQQGNSPPLDIFPCTPGFCAPEQFESVAAVDQRADIYTLGCILYEMLTGQRINPGQDEAERKRLDHEGKLRGIPDALPSSIHEIISTCIQTDPADRYSDWSALEVALTASYREHAGQYPEALVLPVGGGDETTRERSETFLNLGKSFYDFGDMARATEFIDQGLTLARVTDDSEQEARLLLQRGIAQLAIDNFQAASDDMELALTIVRDSETKESLADVLSMLGMLHVRKEEYEKAMDFLQQALVVTRECSNREAEASVLGNLGSAYGQSGNPEKAAEYFRELLSWCEESGDEVLRSQTLASLGVASYDLEKYPEAIGFLQQAQEIYQRHGDDPGRLHVLEHLWKSLAASSQQQDAMLCRQEYEALASSLKSGA